MKEYNNMKISIIENGFLVSYEENGDEKIHTFPDIKKVRKFVEENISPTNEIKEFSDALDDKNEPAQANTFSPYM